RGSAPYSAAAPISTSPSPTPKASSANPRKPFSSSSATFTKAAMPKNAQTHDQHHHQRGPGHLPPRPQRRRRAQSYMLKWRRNVFFEAGLTIVALAFSSYST